MVSSFIGPHIIGMFSRWEAYLDWVAWAKPRLSVVVDAPQLASLTCDALERAGAGGKVISRFSFDERAYQAHTDARAWVDFLLTNHNGDPRPYVELSNEDWIPPLGSEGRAAFLAGYADWTLRCMDRFREKGQRCAPGGLSTAVPELEDFHQVDGLKRVLDAVADDDNALLHCHVYFTLHPRNWLSLEAAKRPAEMCKAQPRLWGKIAVSETGAEHDAKVPGAEPWRVMGWGEPEYFGHLVEWSDILQGAGVFGAALFTWRG